MNNKFMDIVSIILPTFNRANYIVEAINSVINQSYKNFELIIIDDGSTDSSIELIQNIKDHRIILITQMNYGRSIARNNGLAMAKGRYITFLDSDDIYLQNKLELQIEYMDKHPEFGMTYTAAHCIDSDGKLFANQPYSGVIAGDIYKYIAFYKPLTITLPTVMIRREILDEIGYFDTAMERFEDTDLWRRVAKRYLIGAINEPTCLLRTHSENALLAQDPMRIRNSVDFYVNKIFQEDADIDHSFLNLGASRLYEYYGTALLSVPGWHYSGLYMLKKSLSYCPSRFLVLFVASIKSTLKCLIQRARNKEYS